MASELQIAISAEELLHVGPLSIPNTLFTSFLVTVAIVLFLVFAHSQLSPTGKPSRLQALLEMIVEGFYGLVESVTGPGKKALLFTPIIASFMVFIALNNWVEQLPGFHTITITGEPTIELVDLPAWVDPESAYASTAPEPPNAPQAEEGTIVGEEITAAEEDVHLEEEAEEKHNAVALLRGANVDLNLTLALAILSVLMTQLIGIKYAGLGYFKKFFNFSNPINTFIGILELLSEFSKILSFGFRLFGNIFAGEVLIMVISYLVPVILPVPFMAFELFVGGLQAYVFAMLSLVFFNMAASEHH